MGCRSDYQEAGKREIESKRVCELLKYVFTERNQPVPEAIEKGAANYYGDLPMLDANTSLLCAYIRSVPEDVVDKLLYNGRNPEARKLADWWDEHKLADAKREAEEQNREKIKALQQQALSKLSAEEIEALKEGGWDDR